MSSSRSSPTNTTATTTNASETNEAATNTQGVTVIGSKGTNLTSTSNTHNVTTNISTDDGAVLAGTKTAQLALSDNTGLTETLAGDYFKDTENSATESASLVSNVLTQGISFLSANQAATNAEVNSLAQANATNVANEGTALANIATANDTSLASQSTAFATEAFKIAAVVILGVAVIYFATRKA